MLGLGSNTLLNREVFMTVLAIIAAIAGAILAALGLHFLPVYLPPSIAVFWFPWLVFAMGCGFLILAGKRAGESGERVLLFVIPFVLTIAFFVGFYLKYIDWRFEHTTTTVSINNTP